MDQNLKKTRHELVPDLVSEDNFWRNYFYKIECSKAELGVQTRLGPRKTSQEMRQPSQRQVPDEEAKAAPRRQEPAHQEIEMKELPKSNEKPPQMEESKVAQNTAVDDEEAEVAELQV